MLETICVNPIYPKVISVFAWGEMYAY